MIIPESIEVFLIKSNERIRSLMVGYQARRVARSINRDIIESLSNKHLIRGTTRDVLGVFLEMTAANHIGAARRDYEALEFYLDPTYNHRYVDYVRRSGINSLPLANAIFSPLYDAAKRICRAGFLRSGFDMDAARQSSVISDVEAYLEEFHTLRSSLIGKSG
ncbi:hypothetical protein HYT18_02070 [Candidatus Microgenomates bacterium]|nr:hypothetical protein [Candidatus Microgenomates bacterium]